VAKPGVLKWGVWGRCRQRGPGAEPVVRRSGGLPPEAEGFLAIRRLKNLANVLPCEVFGKLLKYAFENSVCVASAIIRA